jgi:hypothetical protein
LESAQGRQEERRDGWRSRVSHLYNRAKSKQSLDYLFQRNIRTEEARLAPYAFSILFICYVHYKKRRNLTALAANDFPGVKPDGFEQWRHLEVRSLDIFLGVIAALAISGLLLSVIQPGGTPTGRPPTPGEVRGVVLLIGGYFLSFLLGLTVSAIYGSKAARLKKTLGIEWPKRTDFDRAGRGGGWRAF